MSQIDRKHTNVFNHRTLLVQKLMVGCLCLTPACLSAGDSPSAAWPRFRGVSAAGTESGFASATQWDATDPGDESLLWKSSVPGLGHSSPTIVGNRIFITSAVSKGEDALLQTGRSGSTTAVNDGEQSWLVLCYDKTTGTELWRRTACEGVPKTTRHLKSSHANATIAVDGDNVVAFFGSEGLYCYDLNGNLKWKKDLGVIDVSWKGIGWGYSSSPAIHDGHIVVVCDEPDDPHVAALNLDNGDEIWRTTRSDASEHSWGSPLIYEIDHQSRVVLNGWPWIVAYDLTDGAEVWRIKGGGDIPIPTPFVANDNIYITSSHGGQSPIIAVRTDSFGNLSESESAEEDGLVWRVEKGGAYMSTPVVVGEHIYTASSNGVLRCFHAITGEKVYEERLGRRAYVVSSLVASDDKIYCASEDGTVYVIAAGPEYKVLSSSRLGDACLATPAISEGILYFRTAHSLLAIAPGDQARSAEEIATEKKPNILFIAVDDLRPTLGCYGDKRALTPHIDELADRGVRFNRAYCQVAVCNPSRASLMTGLRPDTLGVWTLPIHFREAKPDAVTLPQWLRRRGYTAVSHGKIYHNPTPDPQSWSEPIRDSPRLPYFYPDGTRDLIRDEMAKLPGNDWRKNNLRGPATASPNLPDHQLIDGARTEMCIEDLRRLGKSDKPFFLAMGYIRPHLSFVAPKKYWDLYDPTLLPVPGAEQIPEGSPPYAMHNNSEFAHYVDLMQMPKPWDDEQLSETTARRLVHGYYACVSYIDAQIGRLLRALDEEGLADNTIVVLWSDHGYKLGEYRGWGKMTNYEIDTRVPLIISAPSMKPTAGRSTEALAELLDLFPTLCELAAVDRPDFAEGTSLVPVLQDTDARVRQAAVSQYYRRHEGSEYMGYSLRTDEHRYVEWRDFATGETKAQELYDHTAEASSHLGQREAANLADSAEPGLMKSLSALLESTHPRKELSLTPSVHTSPSGRKRLAVRFRFQNEYIGEVSVYPITPAGRRSRARKLAVGESVNYQARIGGVFVVESKDGRIHEIHPPSWPAKTIVIRPPADGPNATPER